MPRYEFACSQGHLSELIQPMSAELPANLVCHMPGCDLPAARVWHPPAAIHFRAPGFYSTDVRARQERKRRPNAGDDLPVPHDEAARRIARAL